MPAHPNSALCLRFDLDTFSTRHAFTRDVGWEEYRYLPRLLRVAGVYGARLQFCACGVGLQEHPREVRAIQSAGHPVDSHLHTHWVTLLDPVERVAEELVAAEQVFRREGIAWAGIGATGMYAESIDNRRDIQNLLIERGYRWCSTKFNLKRPLEELQPAWLDEWLLEIPCAGWSDRTWWYIANQGDLHPQNQAGEKNLSHFIEHVLTHLRRAAEKGLVYAIDLHPGVLARHDPGCEFLIAVLAEAKRLGVPTMDMNQIYGWQLALRELAKLGHTVTAADYLVAEEGWQTWAQPLQQPEKVLDYLAGWQTRPNVYRDGVSINRFGLRGADCLRTKPAGVKRVLCVGDSTVFGVAPDSAPWPAQLQALLDKSHPLQYEILNAGVNGFSAFNVLRRAELLMRQLRPDALLVSVLANDLWGHNPADYPDYSTALPPSYWIEGRPYPEKTPAERRQFPDRETFTPPNFAVALQQMVATCREQGAKPILCTVAGLFPTPGKPISAYQRAVMHYPAWIGDDPSPSMRLLYDRYNATIRQVAEKTGADLIDVADYFDTHYDDARGPLFFDTCHALAEGNAAVAEGVARRLPTLL